jgi:hypothetical protein
MTGRTTTLATETTTISQADLDRIEAEQKLHSEQQRRAAVVVSGSARDADDARMLLDMLGLDHDVLVAARKKCGAHVGSTARRSCAA